MGLLIGILVSVGSLLLLLIEKCWGVLLVPVPVLFKDRDSLKLWRIAETMKYILTLLSYLWPFRKKEKPFGDVQNHYAEFLDEAFQDLEPTVDPMADTQPLPSLSLQKAAESLQKDCRKRQFTWDDAEAMWGPKIDVKAEQGEAESPATTDVQVRKVEPFDFVLPADFKYLYGETTKKKEEEVNTSESTASNATELGADSGTIGVGTPWAWWGATPPPDSWFEGGVHDLGGLYAAIKWPDKYDGNITQTQKEEDMSDKTKEQLQEEYLAEQLKKHKEEVDKMDKLGLNAEEVAKYIQTGVLPDPKPVEEKESSYEKAPEHQGDVTLTLPGPTSLGGRSKIDSGGATTIVIDDITINLRALKQLKSVAEAGAEYTEKVLPSFSFYKVEFDEDEYNGEIVNLVENDLFSSGD